MKRLTLIAFSLALFATACKQKATTTTVVAADSIPADLNLKGLFKADFGEDPLYLVINFQTGQHIAGYDQHKGLHRNVSGEIKKVGDHWVVSLREPGDNPYDGSFVITFDWKQPIKGTWKPFNAAVSKEKSFTMVQIKDGDQHDDNVLSMSGLVGDHSDISFEKDGSCELNYYKKITDSTFGLQMITLRGSFKQANDKIYLKWTNAPEGRQANDTLDIEYQTDGENKKYVTGIKNSEFTFFQEAG